MVVVFFFFKQKTAYDMRISDWSSDVCSSDLMTALAPLLRGDGDRGLVDQVWFGRHHPALRRRVEQGGVGDPAVARRRVVDPERHRAGLLAEQHVPSEAVALAGPAVVTRVGEVTQGEQIGRES